MKLYLLAGLLLALWGVQEPQLHLCAHWGGDGDQGVSWLPRADGVCYSADDPSRGYMERDQERQRIDPIPFHEAYRPPPFDVPPKEWDGPELDWGCQPSEESTVCMDTRIARHHRACEDKSRFLLMSEDGKWHCLALTANRERERGGAR